jgi:hypothetical protein
MMTHVYVNVMQSDICEAMEIEEPWVDEALDTLRLLELYGAGGQRYEDSQVYDLLNDDTAMGQPRIHLLELLKQWVPYMIVIYIIC